MIRFGTGGWRAVIGEDFTRENVRRVAAGILALMRERHGRMPYSDATSPEIIRDKFGVSKAAFKRALGHLLKEGKIEQRDGWTWLTGENIEELKKK